MARSTQLSLVIEDAAVDDLAAVRGLFREYEAWLDEDLCFQSFEAELASLPGGYTPPWGCLLLARAGGTAVGCVALRSFDDNAGEVKRLYVRPDKRGQGFGLGLMQALLVRARRAGYRRLLLDTLSRMGAANALYRQLGFVQIPAYYHNPIPGALYLALDLVLGQSIESSVLGCGGELGLIGSGERLPR